MKKFVSLVVAYLLVSITACAQPLYTKTAKENVTGGVNRKVIQKFYGDYALNINIITVDLNNPHLSLELLKNSGGSDKTDTVMNLASSEKNVVAAINADFFSAYKGDQNFSLGIEIKDGELLQSHINSNMAAGLFDGEKLALSYIEFAGEVTAPNGEKTALAHINKPTDYYGALLMYTPEFNGSVSPFLPQGITAVTVVEETVTAKGVSLGGTIPVPENGYILVIDDNMTPFLEHNFSVGDKVEVTLSAESLIKNTDTAFGGGTLLLSDGKKTEITHSVNGNNPRTAIGTNKDGTVVYLLTVDGRQTVSRGVSLDTLADICLEAGMVNAMNLDGGGSTAMVARTLSNEKLHYINSPTEKRKVINAVGITSDAEPGATAGFIVSASKKNVLSGDSVKLNLIAYDENFNTPKTISNSYKWVVSKGKGTVKNNVYYAKGSGKTVLDLYYKGEITDSCEINVIDRVCGIVSPAELVLEKGKAATISGVSVFDSEGNTASVDDLSLLNPSFDKAFVSLSGGNIKALREGAGYLTLSCDDAIRNIKIICGEHTADTIPGVTGDKLYGIKEDGFLFNVMGYLKAENLFERLVYAKGIDIFRSADASAVVGGPLLSDLTPNSSLTASSDKWSEVNHENAKIISVDLSDSGVMLRGDRWKKLDGALSGAVQKNIFVLLNRCADFQDALDKAAFYSMLENAARSKNVFVIYNGDENFCRIENGVRYISLADARDESSIANTLKNMKYLSFNVTSGGVTYCFKNLY